MEKNNIKANVSAHDGTVFNFKEFRSLASLPEEAWRQIDDRVIHTAKSQLVGIRDLRATPGLTRRVDGMGMSVYTTNRVSEVTEAKMAQSPDTRGENSQLDYDTQSLPMVVTYKDFIVNTKQVAMSKRANVGLDTTLIDESTRSVARMVEDTLFNGDYVFSGAPLYGYTKFPDRNTYDLPANWDLPATDADQIFDDVNNMVQLSIQANHYGPWRLYIPAAYEARMNQDYYIGGAITSPIAPSRTIRDRVLQIPGLLSITMSRDLAPDNVVLVEMDSSTVELIVGMELMVGDWEPSGTKRWNHLFKAMTMMMPFLKSDYLGQCGIVHGAK
jgi:uncharacterized linocin/CFP29 family protein